MCKVMLTIFVFILIKAQANEQEIELNLDNFKKEKFGNEKYSYDDAVYIVTENIPLRINLKLQSSYYIDTFQCWHHLYSYKIGAFPVNYCCYENGQYKHTLKITTLINKMGGTWKCTITKHEFMGTYTFDDIYFEILVKSVEPPQIMLVNGAALTTTRISDIYYTTEYKYSEGDMINVACINYYDQCTLQMNYDNSDETGIVSNEAFGSAAGLRMRLLAHHNNTRMVCTRSCGQKIIVLVLFFLQETSNDITNLKINNQIIKGGHLSGDTIYYNYFYFENDKPTSIVGETYRNDIIVSPLCDHCYLNGEKITKLNRLTKITYTAKNKNSTKVERVEIGFTPLKLRDEDFLSMDLPNENILKEEYVLYNEYKGILTYKVKWIYYEFKDGDILSINCSTTRSSTFSVLDFNGTETINAYSIKTITLRLSDNNTVLTCANTEKNHVWERIHILFRTYTPTDSGESTCVLVLVGLLMVIVVVSVCIGIYRIRKRQGRDDMQENFATIQTDADTSIPTFPAQWESNYANIENINIKNKNNNKRTEDLYANVKPPSVRKCSEANNIYANNKASEYNNDDIYANQSMAPKTSGLESSDLQYANPNDFEFVFKKKKDKMDSNETSEYAQLAFENMEENDDDDYATINDCR